MREGAANYQADFTVAFAMLWLVIVVTLGSRTVDGAIFAAGRADLFPELLHHLHVSSSWQTILFGLGAITFARHPEGILDYQKRVVLNRMQRSLDRRNASKQHASSPSAVALPDVSPPQPPPSSPALAEKQSK